MDSGNSSQPPVAGLLLVALVLGTVFFIEPPLQGSRPKDPPKVSDLSSGEQTIQARLWQDPFEAITLNQRAGKESGTRVSGAQSADPSLPDAEPMPGECNTEFTWVHEPDRSNQGKGVLLVMTPGSPLCSALIT